MSFCLSVHFMYVNLKVGSMSTSSCIFFNLKLIKVVCNKCKKRNWCIIFLGYFHGSVVYVEYPTVIFMKTNISRFCLFQCLCSSSPLGQCISFGQSFFLITRDFYEICNISGSWLHYVDMYSVYIKQHGQRTAGFYAAAVRIPHLKFGTSKPENFFLICRAIQTRFVDFISLHEPCYVKSGH